MCLSKCTSNLVSKGMLRLHIPDLPVCLCPGAVLSGNVGIAHRSSVWKGAVIRGITYYIVDLYSAISLHVLICPKNS